MAALNHKIDFALVCAVRNANPNGDPLDGNRPRTTFSGFGEITDVCLKRKIRNRLLDEGYRVFVQSDDKRSDGCRSLKDRAENEPALKECTAKMKENGSNVSKNDYAAIACQTWYDVRAFGQVFAFKDSKKGNSKKGADKKDDDKTEEQGSDAVSIGVRGPVSIQSAFSITPITVTSNQITKSVNLETGVNPDIKAPDTMGMKHRVDFGVYVTYGAVNVQLAEKTGFSEEDAQVLKEMLRTLFRNDETSARPAGSMEVVKLIWWEHNCANGQYSSAKVHRTLHVTADGNDEIGITLDELTGLTPEIVDGE